MSLELISCERHFELQTIFLQSYPSHNFKKKSTEKPWDGDDNALVVAQARDLRQESLAKEQYPGWARESDCMNIIAPLKHFCMRIGVPKAFEESLASSKLEETAKKI